MKRFEKFVRRIRNRFRKRAKEVQKVERKHRKIIIASIVIIVLLTFLLTTKAYLYVNFLLGNDIVVGFSVDDENLHIKNGESVNFTVEASVATNPFCKASCQTYLEDLSSDNLLDTESFNLRPGLPFSKTYSLTTTRLGEGQEIFRFGMDCQAVATLLCHTDSEPTKRSIIITLDHSLNDYEEKLKSELNIILDNLEERIVKANATSTVLLSTAENIEPRITIQSKIKELETIFGTLTSLFETLEHLQKLWEEQDYEKLSTETQKLSTNVDSLDNDLSSIESSLREIFNEFNSAVRHLEESYSLLAASDKEQLNATAASDWQEIAKDYENTLRIFKEKNNVSGKRNAAVAVKASILELQHETEEINNLEALRIFLHNDIYFSIICESEKVCITRPSVPERATSSLDVSEACDDRSTLLTIISTLNGTLTGQNNLTELNVFLDMKKQHMLASVPENETHTKIAKTILVNNYANQSTNLTNAAFTLIANPPDKCVFYNATPDVTEFTEKMISFDTPEIAFSSSFQEQPQMCCTFGKCKACCVDGECKGEGNTPIVFLHGHAFNKDTKAEYSLDGFNKIQDALESDGILNLGAISLYTDRDAPHGIWGRHDVPVSIKASYYFDIFEEPENYFIVQTKSENIDTYAIRFKELLDTVEHRTGRSDVIIVAHSMGGLVARRYMQIFGHEKVDKLIMLGTPNYGVDGSTADLCGWIGEHLECRDMTKGSLFLNKLNRQSVPLVETHSIVGTGCGQGDGVVRKASAELEGSTIHYVEGTCTTFEKLHTEMLDTSKYPKTLATVRKVIGVAS